MATAIVEAALLSVELPADLEFVRFGVVGGLSRNNVRLGAGQAEQRDVEYLFAVGSQFCRNIGRHFICSQTGPTLQSRRGLSLDELDLQAIAGGQRKDSERDLGFGQGGGNASAGNRVEV